MSGYHLGINLGHDRAAALVTGGEIVVAIQQERLDRCKYSIGLLHQAPGDSAQVQLPNEAIRYCLEASGVRLSELMSITANMPGVDYSNDILRRQLPPEVMQKVRCIASHHLAHAYSAYWPSGFDDAVILVADATGTTGVDGRTESYTLYKACGSKISLLHAERVPAHLAGLSTLGFIYEYISRKAGFVTQVGAQVTVPESGKLMGLAPYGNEQRNWHRWIRPITNSYSLNIPAYDLFLEVAALEKRYDNGQGKPYLRSYLVDLAYKVQKELEQAIVHLVRKAVEDTGIRKLCLAGGVALNSVANYTVLQEVGLDDIFIFPAAGDSGVAAGCALWSYAHEIHDAKRIKLRNATLGRIYDQKVIYKAVERFADRIQVEALSESQLLKRTAEVLAQGHIVARFEKGSEYGPRALGHRSILADPTFERMKDILNARVKFREPFRPFAPVVPEENIALVFEQQVASPYMLLVSPIKERYRAEIPAVTHHDRTGRVQTVTLEANPFLYRLCHALVATREHLPIVLNTSFNVAGQPIVESPEEAIQTFLNTDIDYLCLEDLWIAKRDVPVKSYAQQLAQLEDSRFPQGLASGQPALSELMQQLDRALFFGDTAGCPWLADELRRLSREGGRFKETSRLFRDTSYGIDFQTQWASNVVCILDPLDQSEVIDRSGTFQSSAYTLSEVALLQAIIRGSKDELDKLRIDQQLSTLEWEERMQWGLKQLAQYRLQPNQRVMTIRQQDTPLSGLPDRTLAPFADERFSAREVSGALRAILVAAAYSESTVCKLLGTESLQRIEPTYLHYYDRFLLPQSDLGDLIRFFLLRVALSAERLKGLFGSQCLDSLIRLGVVKCRGDKWASAIDLYCADGLFIATDHHHMVHDGDQLDEDPVMYIGLDSLGLVHTAPRYPAERALDLCTGSGIQALVASRYAKEVLGIDINPRAIRFARFNACLNGIYNARFIVGDLYSSLKGREFDLILANPPFVASPRQELRFRDGGACGEDVLSRIVSEAAHYLTENGRLHVVADLADAADYEKKLDAWWSGGPAHKLVLQTADRNELQFAIPHTHAPFGQRFETYNTELEQWVTSFRQAKLTSINFGYICIHRLPPDATSSYYIRTIHNPDIPIHEQVKRYFEQRESVQGNDNSQLFLRATEDLRFRIEFRIDDQLRTPERRYQLFVPDNPYYTTYTVNEDIFRGLELILRRDVQLSELPKPYNQEWILELIYKGLVHVSSFPFNKKHSKKSTPSLTEPAQPQYCVQEAQTKTTPTCLSSYIGQL
nr:methyltransferase [Gammaproteobacteria bacterium]